jgi:broad specificity phosphatase PhoE
MIIPTGELEQSMNTIYLVRHAENTANLTKEFSHRLVDYSLTAKGIIQAQQTAVYFSDKPIAEIYSSPLKRARETADIIAQELHLPVGIVEQFREVNVGSLEERPPDAENWALHERILRDWKEGRHESTFPAGENYTMLLARMRSGLREISANKSNCIVVAHGGIITATIADLCPAVDIEQLLRIENHNCSITEIELSIDGEHMEAALKRWAFYEHLHGYAAEFVSGTYQFETRP